MMDFFIDLRSDTVTKPCNRMLEAMLNARVGDDVYGEDPTVNELQEYVADLLGKECGLYVPSGTMSNQLGVKINTAPGDEVIIDQNGHIFYFETAASAIISNIQIRTLPSEFGEVEIDLIEQSIRPDVYYFPKTALVCLENTHNRYGGTILSLNYIKEVSDLCSEKNIALHLDGARLWNASVETGISMYEYSKYFDTVSVCLSKGLGAPVGSVLCGDREKIDKAKKWRKILGGGMRQAGILAAAGLYAVKNNVTRLKEDHKNAKLFAELISKIDGLTIDFSRIQTNIVALIIPNDVPINELISKCKKQRLLFNSIGENAVRIVFHLDVTKEHTIQASEIFRDVINEIRKK